MTLKTNDQNSQLIYTRKTVKIGKFDVNILSKWRVKVGDIFDNSTAQKRQHVIHLTPQKHSALFLTNKAMLHFHYILIVSKSKPWFCF